METTTREIEISTEHQIQKPPLSSNGRFYRIYSPDKILLRQLEMKTIDLKFKVKLPDGIQGIIPLLPTFIEQSLSLENGECVTSNTWDNPIKLKLWNRNLHCTATINKNEEIAWLFLIHRRGDETCVTYYKLTY